MSGIRPLRIAQVAPPLERVPPLAYGGTERVIFELTSQLAARGHDVTVFASGDSDVPCRLVPTVPEALRPAGFGGDPAPHFLETIQALLDHASEFDVIHSHLEWWSILLARVVPVPVVSTFHGRLDLQHSRRLLAGRPEGLVAISRSQAAAHPNVDWTIIHNGLSLHEMPAGPGGDAFCFVGRVDPGKGVVEAIEVARLSGRPLRIAAKVGTLPEQVDYYETVFRPAVEAAGSLVEFIGEVGPEERNRLFAESFATLMPGAWPEPFGLVAIESLACGTPILARRVGALPEIIRDGVDGFFGDDPLHLSFHAEGVAGLDRTAIRERAIERFSAARMADRYEELYLRQVDEAPPPTVRIPPRRSSGLPARVAGPASAATIVDRPARVLPGRPVAGILVPVGPGRDPGNPGIGSTGLSAGPTGRSATATAEPTDDPRPGDARAGGARTRPRP
ncbi:MAG TPA: glycosyltransferase family 4 protein [Candidatus Limnocylindrales bacterium]|nr:glycosyltransferase family 4 protein [Candidatus Limnocylindrales bacterium]